MFVNERATTTAGGEAIIWDYHDVAVDFCDPDIRSIQQGVRYEGAEKKETQICYIMYHIAQPQLIVCEFSEAVGYWKMGKALWLGDKITLNQAAEFIKDVYAAEQFIPLSAIENQLKNYLNEKNNPKK